MILRPYQSAASDAIFKEWQENDEAIASASSSTVQAVIRVCLHFEFTGDETRLTISAQDFVHATQSPFRQHSKREARPV